MFLLTKTRKDQKPPANGFLKSEKLTDKSDIPSPYNTSVVHVYQNYGMKMVLALMLILFMASVASATTLNVGAGQTYNTDGSSDQVQINSAIQAGGVGDIVYLHPGTYIIDQPIRLKSGVTLAGSGFASCTVKSKAWDTFYTSSMVQIYGVSNVAVYGFTINGGEESLSTAHQSGHCGHGDGFNGVHISEATNIVVHDMYFTLMDGDAVRFDHHMDAAAYLGDSENVQVYNLQINCCGHDGLGIYTVNNLRVYNVIVNIFCNSGMRIASGATGVEVDHCTFYSNTGSGYAGIELQNALANPQIHNNIFRNIHTGHSVAITTYDASGTAHIYNNVFWDCPGGFIETSGISVTEAGNLYPGSGATESTYTAQGYGYGSTYESSGGYTDSGGVPLPVYNGSTLPTISQPTNGQSVETHSGYLTFTWTNLNSTSYLVQVSTIANFSSLLYNVTTTSPSLNEPMSSGTYYWRMAALIDNGTYAGQWTNLTDSTMFNITGNTNTPASGSGLYGVVYGDSKLYPIRNAVVTIVNASSSWSTTIVTDPDGKYSVQVTDGIYYVYAAATDYQSTIVGSGLPITVIGGYAVKDIALVKSQTYFPPNYVTFTVMNILNTRYQGVTIDVYREGNSISDNNPDFTDTTDVNGQHTFGLDQKTTYTVYAHDENQNIDKTITVSGGASTAAMILVWGATQTTNANVIPTTPRPSEYIRYGYYSGYTDTTHGSINQTIVSLDNNTFSYITTIKSINLNGTFDGMYIYSYAKGNVTSVNDSVVVPRNATYLINTTINHPVVGIPASYNHTIEIKASQIRKGLDYFDYQWQYEAVLIIVMIMTAGIFGRRDEIGGGLILVLECMFGMWSGWFEYDTAALVMAMVGILWFFARAFREGN